MAERKIRHLKRGGLHGWCAHCGAPARHRALRRSVRASGYATTVERLGALRRFDHSREPEVARAAEADQHWLHREYREGRRE